MKPMTLPQLLKAAANTIENNAEESRRSCVVGARDWACGDCKPRQCPTRARWALDMALVKKLRDTAAIQ